jgi:tRNA-modifying protein YgfZ
MSQELGIEPYMNENWKIFLLNEQISVDDGNRTVGLGIENVGDKSIFPLTHLAILKVSGNDAAKLLQGQVTCNVNELSETKSSLAAMCNPKGRAIATFLLVKKVDAFLLVLPVELLETVQKKLQMYVLRSDVKITDASDEFCLIGLAEPSQSRQGFFTGILQDCIAVDFPASTSRKLLITDVDNAMRFWSEKVESQGFRKASPDEWRCLDILSGIPWLTNASSEEFIPQMLNLDKLGGISFNKGCYTGQEIVARTHYLGKTKREMFLADCQCSTPPEPMSSIINKDSEEHDVVGKVLLAQQGQGSCKMLVILQFTESGYDNLGLQDDKLAQIEPIPFRYD